MAIEIERRFLPKKADWHPKQHRGIGRADPIVQGYFWPGETVIAFIQCKGEGPSRRFNLILNIQNDPKPLKLALPQEDGLALHAATKGLPLSKAWTLRVRRSRSLGGQFCLKGKADGLARPEYEFPLKPGKTRRLLQLCRETHIHKKRYTHDYKGRLWEIDVFRDPLPGHPPIIIEVELPTPEAAFKAPPYVETEITGRKNLSNAKMARLRWETAQQAQPL